MVDFGMALRKILKRFAAASSPVDQTQAKIQRYHTGLDAEFGQTITDKDITFAVKREPIAYLLTFQVAHDVYDNWFEVLPLEEGTDKEKFDEAVQKALLKLKAKDVFTQAAVFERAYGWSTVVVGYEYKASTLKEPVEAPEKIRSLMPYGPTLITDVKVDEDKESERFGLPEIYKIQMSNRDQAWPVEPLILSRIIAPLWNGLVRVRVFPSL
jgi:hypothetical protein